MNTKRYLRVAAFVAVLVLLVASIGNAFADSGSATYDYLIGTGILCGLDPTACPAIAMADNGDTIEITGAGTLSIHPKSATGGGAFVHKDAAGNVLGGGTWAAQKLLSFIGYGCGGPGLPDDFCGGRATLQVHLVATSGLESNGILQVDCLIGSFPAGAVEGIRLVIQALDFNFNKEISGLTLFIQQ